MTLLRWPPSFSLRMKFPPAWRSRLAWTVAHSPWNARRHPRAIDYTRFVRIMKVVFPAMAVTLLGMVVVWARLTSEVNGFKVGFAHIDPASIGNLRMSNARYFGIDQGNHPFSITADWGEQVQSNGDMIELGAPKADFVSKSGEGIVVIADHGVYHQREQLLDLDGNVSLYHEQGYELHTEEATLDLQGNSAQSARHVDGRGPQGRIDGDGFKIYDHGDHVQILGRSSANLPGQGRPLTPPTPGVKR